MYQVITQSTVIIVKSLNVEHWNSISKEIKSIKEKKTLLNIPMRPLSKVKGLLV